MFRNFILLVPNVPCIVQLLNQQSIPSYSFLYFIFLISNELGTVSFVCLFLKRELVNWQCRKTIKRLCPLLLYITDPCFTGYPNPLLYQSVRSSKEKWVFCIANSFYDLQLMDLTINWQNYNSWLVDESSCLEKLLAFLLFLFFYIFF